MYLLTCENFITHVTTNLLERYLVDLPNFIIFLLPSISREYHNVTVRPLLNSKKHIFSNWMVSENWCWLEEMTDPSHQVEGWEIRVEAKLYEICPAKVVKLRNRNQPFFMGDLKD